MLLFLKRFVGIIGVDSIAPKSKISMSVNQRPLDTHRYILWSKSYATPDGLEVVIAREWKYC